MRFLPSCLIVLIAALAAAPAAAGQTVVGLAAPLGGSSALLGEQMRLGAEQAIGRSEGFELLAADDGCSAEGGAEAARRFVAARAGIVVGFLCIESIEAALPILKEAGIPVIATGVRIDSLTDRRDRTGWPVFRLAPRASDELRAVSAILTRRWREELFAVIDDGTIHGRETAEGFRLAAEQAGLAPVFVDTFRPQLDNQIGLAGRLRRSGATHVFVGGDRADIAVLGRDAAELGYRLTIAGGETLRSLSEGVDLADGTLMVGLPEWSDVADPRIVRMMRMDGIEPDGYVLPVFAGVEIAIEAVRTAEAREIPLMQALHQGAFATVLGEVRFDEKGDRTGSSYRLFEYRDGKFIQADD